MREIFRKGQKRWGKISRKGSESESREVWDIKMESYQIYPVNSETVGEVAEFMAESQD